MQIDIENLSTVMIVIAAISTVLILLVNFYLYIRHKFPKTVNCWFCNQYTKVPYKNRNNWNCPSCQQYNGFNQDGDYNKVIPAQHDEMLNLQTLAIRKCTQPASNGLCSVCNNNQQLKIHQIANFIPLREDNYDVEIEHFHKQLERAYKLCPRCEETLKNTIQKQNRWLLGLKLIQNRFKSIPVANKDESALIQYLLISILRCVILITAFTHLLFILYNLDFCNKYLGVFPNILQPYVVLLGDLNLIVLNALEILIADSRFSMFFTFYLENIIYKIVTSLTIQLLVCSIGFIFQILYSLTCKLSKTTAFCCCAVWVILGVLTEDFTILHSPFAALVQLTLTLSIIYMVWNHGVNKSTNPIPITKVQFHKMNSSLSQNKYEKPIDGQENISPVKSMVNSSFESLEQTLRSSTPDYKSTYGFSPTQDHLDSLFSKPQQQQYIFGQNPIFENVLNKSPTSFRDLHSIKPMLSPSSPAPSADTCSVYSFNSCIDVDLNKSLNELHLGFSKQHSQQLHRNLVYGRPSISNSVDFRPRPVLSPSRLKNITQNSWVAGGYWKADEAAETFSRSSSQSSGYGSTQAFNSLPSSRNTSICGEIDRFSALSEPIYHVNNNPNAFARSAPSPQQKLPIYPVLRQNSQVFIQPKCFQDNLFNNSINCVQRQSPYFSDSNYSLWNDSVKRNGNQWSKND